jgi:hypothetical protein
VKDGYMIGKIKFVYVSNGFIFRIIAMTAD